MEHSSLALAMVLGEMKQPLNSDCFPLAPSVLVQECPGTGPRVGLLHIHNVTPYNSQTLGNSSQAEIGGFDVEPVALRWLRNKGLS